MKRKLTAADYALLRRMVRDIGPERINQYLAVWYGALPFKGIKIRTERQGAAFRTLHGFVQDYAGSCLGWAFVQICFERKPIPAIQRTPPLADNPA